MNNPHLTPEQIRWLHTKMACLYLSPKYISIESVEIWGGMHFSRTGWCAHAPGKPSLQWLGENFRKAISTSSYLNEFGRERDMDAHKAMKAESGARRRAFEAEIATTYGYKKIEDIGLRCDYVSSEWHYLVDGIVILKPTKRMPGGHRSWPPDKKYPDKRVNVPLSVSDEELGLAIRDAFSRCEAPGRQKINWPRDDEG